MENLIVSFIWAWLWWRIEVVEAQLEGLSFSVMRCANIEVCHLSIFVYFFNRNICFSSNWYLPNIWIIIPWVYLSWMLMDYSILYAKNICYHHMIVYLGCCGQVAGIEFWVECSIVVFIEWSKEVGYLSCLVRIFIYVEYLGL